MTRPTLSICILTYNRARTLRETLESILPQVSDNPEVEVVISDNASTDNTAALCGEFQERFPTLRYCPNPRNIEVDGNIVACIEKARGEYTAFFSDDDLSPPGTFSAILELLHRLNPAILYINHTPFLHDNPSHCWQPLGPVLEQQFGSGKAFFMFAGLGFLSALTLKTNAARQFLDRVKYGRFTAHLDIASRIALSESGTFLYAGGLTVLARYVQDCQYDILARGLVNVTKLHLELKHDNLLSAEDVRLLTRAMVRHRLARAVVSNRCRREGIISSSELYALYGKDPFFHLLITPVLLMPPPALRLARSILQSFRRHFYTSDSRKPVSG